jgi:hypothetical protein
VATVLPMRVVFPADTTPPVPDQLQRTHGGGVVWPYHGPWQVQPGRDFAEFFTISLTSNARRERRRLLTRRGLKTAARVVHLQVALCAIANAMQAVADR